MENVSFVSRYEASEQGKRFNPHIRTVQFLAAVALIVVALAQLTEIFAAP